jgi:hypothetical protein
MKTRIILSVLMLFSLLLKVYSGTWEITQNDVISETNSYVNNMTEIWNIASTVTDKPIKITYSTSIQYNYDFVIIKSVDASNNATTILTLSGTKAGVISTMIPSGKAQVIFTTNGSISYADNPSIYGGINISFSVDYDSFVYNNQHVSGDIQTEGNAFIAGKLGIGTTSPTKKLEIYEGVGGRFSFSALNCSSGYEVAQTLDDTGYKLNIGTSVRDYRISINSLDRLKIFTNDNFSVGLYSMSLLTSGVSNNAMGSYTLNSNTSGSRNNAIGYGALANNTTGNNNQAIGHTALTNSTTGGENCAIGSASLESNTTGVGNMALGFASLYKNTTGSYNLGLGNHAGSFIADGSTGNTTASHSVFIGTNTKALANGQYNQIVIGYNAIGNGGNTVTLGNDEIINTILKGKVGIGTTNPTNKLEIVGNSGVLSYLHSTSNAGNESAFIQFQNGRGLIGYDGQYGGVKIAVSDTTKSIVFTKDFYGVSGELMRITGKGKVGIGRPDPSYKLDVFGNARIKDQFVIDGSGDLGGKINITNSSKTASNQGYMWTIYNMTGSVYGNSLQFWAYDMTNNLKHNRFTITDNGKIGIGTQHPDSMLTVNGAIHAKEVVIDLSVIADYVFDSNYKLRTISEVESFVTKNKHLPGIPSGTEIKSSGLSLGYMQNKLLEKIEELTLYVIKQDKDISELKEEINRLKNK